MYRCVCVSACVSVCVGVFVCVLVCDSFIDSFVCIFRAWQRDLGNPFPRSAENDLCSSAFNRFVNKTLPSLP